MAIAIDQIRLRTIVQKLLPSATLERAEAMLMLEFIQLAAGADPTHDLAEHSVMQCIAQKVSALAGLRTGELLPIAPIDDPAARTHWLHSLGAQLRTRQLRELTYAFVFLIELADSTLTSRERDALDEFQEALEIDDDRATDLVVYLTDLVADSAA